MCILNVLIHACISRDSPLHAFYEDADGQLLSTSNLIVISLSLTVHVCTVNLDEYL